MLSPVSFSHCQVFVLCPLIFLAIWWGGDANYCRLNSSLSCTGTLGSHKYLSLQKFSITIILFLIQITIIALH